MSKFMLMLSVSCFLLLALTACTPSSQRVPREVTRARETLKENQSARRMANALGTLAEWELTARRLEEAKRLANKMLAISNAPQLKSQSADLAYHAYTILGQVALREGNVSQAKEYLAQSGGLDRRYVLRPRHDLARDLLLAGEREAVLEFLSRWETTPGRFPVRRWIWLVRLGVLPTAWTR
jgi:hypothetical protein